jgi:hypothetical protein
MRALTAPPQARPTPPHHHPPTRTPPRPRPAWVGGMTACPRGLSSQLTIALITELATTTPPPATTSPPAATSAVTAGAACGEPDGRTAR